MLKIEQLDVKDRSERHIYGNSCRPCDWTYR